MQNKLQLIQKINTIIKHEGIGFVDNNVEPVFLAQGGSDRSFYRIEISGNSFIVMEDTALNCEIPAYVNIGRFLSENKVGVPEIIAWNSKKQILLMEDLGDLSFYTLLKQTRTKKQVKQHYKKVLIFLAEMQMKATSSAKSCSQLENRVFGYDALRRETDYFSDSFVKRFCNIFVTDQSKLSDEFHRLAVCVSGEPRCFMHRDFQSQNIFLKDGKVKVIDFQTATMGPAQYDLVSVLKDAYFVLDKNLREDLLWFYVDLLDKTGNIKINRKSFIRMFHLSGLQRNMQALGAFAFLSMNKGKTGFLKYIPPAVTYLEEALSLFAEYSELKQLIENVVLLVGKPDFLHCRITAATQAKT